MNGTNNAVSLLCQLLGNSYDFLCVGIEWLRHELRLVVVISTAQVTPKRYTPARNL